MKKMGVRVLVFLLSLFPMGLQAGLVKSFDIVPPTLFTFEERPVTFLAKVESSGNSPESEFFLVQWDPVHEKVIFHWRMADDASFGDFQANDHIYTRKIQFKDKKKGVRTFSVVEIQDETKIVRMKKADLGPVAFLNIVQRPSFIELMKEIWVKIKAQTTR